MDLGSRIVKGSLRREGVERPSDPLAFPDNIFHERNTFSAEGIRYICKSVERTLAMPQNEAVQITVAQAVCIVLRFFFTMGTYMHSVGDAENLSKRVVCRAIFKVVALTELLNMFVVFGVVALSVCPSWL